MYSEEPDQVLWQHAGAGTIGLTLLRLWLPSWGPGGAVRNADLQKCPRAGLMPVQMSEAQSGQDTSQCVWAQGVETGVSPWEAVTT